MSAQGKKIGVVLAGCGYLDGAEIHEATLTLLALDRLGADVVVMIANYTISKDNYGTELWIGGRDNEAYFNNTWSVYDLGENKGEQAGYFGVSGAPDGQIRIVGSGIDTGNWQDGLILVRKP